MSQPETKDVMPVSTAPLLICLPVAERVRSHAFYREALGLAAFGPIAGDGVPEPLQFKLNDAANLMLIPTAGFNWVIGSHTVAPPGTSECLLGMTATSDAEVDGIMERAQAAGAAVVAPAAPQPWGYEAAFADPDGHVWSITRPAGA